MSPATGTTPRLVAVDWGTTRMRAVLLGPDGTVLDQMTSDGGVSAVPPGGFPAALETACAPWFTAHGDLPVVMAGMVGSRNGWAEAPYVACPCRPADLARAMLTVPGAGRRVSIVPGVDTRWPDGSYDVMRGEEAQAFGTGVTDGLVCLPGTHSKWVAMEGGAIRRFATFITGELYAAMTASFIGRLAAGPDRQAEGLEAGLVAAAAPGGLGRLLFQARARVLGGDLAPEAVRPFLSALIVGQEIAGAEALFGSVRRVHLVAASPQREVYEAALAARGVDVAVLDPAKATLDGMRMIAEAQ